MKTSFWQRMPVWLRRTLLILLCLAVAGGGIYGVLLLVRGNSGAVKVYPITAFISNYADDQAETQGIVTPDKIQSVYVSETQKVTRLYVREGDIVSAGDPILAFDTTLTDLELERQRIKVEKLKLDLSEAERNLVKVNTYRVYVPAAPYVPGEEPVYPALDLPFYRAGDGSEERPYVFIWNEKCLYDEEFINRILPLVPGTEELSSGELPVVHAVFEIRSGDALEGDVIQSWSMKLQRTISGGCVFTIGVPSGNYDGSAEPEGGDDPGYYDTTPTFSLDELMSLRREAQNKITTLELDLKQAELRYETLQYEISNGIVYSRLDGRVKTVRDPESAREEGLPAVLISGGGGYFVTGALSETELPVIHVGDTVTVMSWQTYSQNEAKILSISEYPTDNNNFSHWSQGNSNSTLYPFTVYLDEDAPVREGEWVNITYNVFGDQSEGVFLDNMFILRQNGRSFIYVKGADGRLEEREVSTGRSLWGSYTQILGGITPEDYIAFPYGRAVREGSKTEIASPDALYSY